MRANSDEVIELHAAIHTVSLIGGFLCAITHNLVITTEEHYTNAAVHVISLCLNLGVQSCRDYDISAGFFGTPFRRLTRSWWK